jgi:mRNA-degrading endonuclease toxin of MazEF toxin-antitoxin module
LNASGVFDAQQLVTVPQVKLIRPLGTLSPEQLALVEATVRNLAGPLTRSVGQMSPRWISVTES